MESFSAYAVSHNTSPLPPQLVARRHGYSGGALVSIVSFHHPLPPIRVLMRILSTASLLASSHGVLGTFITLLIGS